MIRVRKTIGTVILVEHSGRPTVWPVKRSGQDDRAHLLEIFETAKSMCRTEVAEGGTLKLMDAENNLIDEWRG